jgi:outer membrane protein assembly factor BamB
LALDAVTGRRRWKSGIGETLVTAPAIDGNTLYIGSLYGYLHAVDAGSGGLFWRSVLSDEKTNTRPFSIDFPPVVYRNVVTVESGTGGGNLFAFSQPMLYNGLVVVGAEDGRVYGLNP